MTIQRRHSGPRMSQIVVHNDTVYLAGIVGDDRSADIATQTQQVLAKIDGYLAEVGTDKSKLLCAEIWISDMALFNDMNAVWDADRPGQPAHPRLRSGTARPPRLQSRDHRSSGTRLELPNGQSAAAVNFSNTTPGIIFWALILLSKDRHSPSSWTAGRYKPEPKPSLPKPIARVRRYRPCDPAWAEAASR